MLILIIEILLIGLKLDFSINTDSTEASALGYKKNYIQVYSNSWGPNDNGFTVEKPGILLEKTLENAVKNVNYMFINTL